MKDSSAAARIYYIITIEITIILETLCCTSLFQGYCHVRSQEKSCLIIRYGKKTSVDCVVSNFPRTWSSMWLFSSCICDSQTDQQRNPLVLIKNATNQQINKQTRKLLQIYSSIITHFKCCCLFFQLFDKTFRLL